MLTRINVEVHCLQPRWVDVEKCSYRLYLNDELMTERTWIWDMNTYVDEEMIVEIDKNINHVIKVEVIKSTPLALTQLALRNIQIDGVKGNDRDGHKDNVTFILG